MEKIWMEGRSNRSGNISDCSDKRNRIYWERSDRSKEPMDLVGNHGDSRHNNRYSGNIGEEVENMNGNKILGIILIGIGIFAAIMAFLTYPW